MARINSARLAMKVTEFSSHTNYVRHDPAVIKAAKEAKYDIAQAYQSTSNLAKETRSSWQRSVQGAGGTTLRGEVA